MNIEIALLYYIVALDYYVAEAFGQPGKKKCNDTFLARSPLDAMLRKNRLEFTQARVLRSTRGIYP